MVMAGISNCTKKYWAWICEVSEKIVNIKQRTENNGAKTITVGSYPSNACRERGWL